MLIGTRPEAIKLMPVIRALEKAGSSPEIYVTGQHDELLRPTLRDLAITPTVDLALLEAASRSAASPRESSKRCSACFGDGGRHS